MLYLHIGSAKTGSTSIQGALKGEALVATTNVERLRWGPEWGQVNFVQALLPGARRHGEALATLGQLAEQAKADPSRTYVFTNEMLFRKGVAPTMARGLSVNGSVPVKVICYLRRPDSYLESSYKQRVKNGRIEAGAASYLESRLDSMDFHGILGEYADCFGVENIVVRPFERDRFPEGNVVLDFMSLIGVDGRREIVEGVSLHRNRSLSAAASELLGNIARTAGGPLHRHTLMQLAKSTDTALRRSGDVYTLAERRAIMAECADDVERVRRDYTPDLDVFFNMGNLAEGQPDPYPTAEEQLTLTRTAAEAAIAAMCGFIQPDGLAGAAYPGGTAPEDGDRAARRLRRARRRAGEHAGGAQDAPVVEQRAARRRMPRARRAETAD